MTSEDTRADPLKVVILGGGPSGAACGMALKRFPDRMGREVRPIILEGKEFTGERHHNQCAGVLSPPLPKLLMEELDLPFPHHLSRGEIRGYVLHTAGERISLEGEGDPSIALRRVHFDAYMLDAARQRGVDVRPARAVDLEFHADRVIVYTESEPIEADVVVGAFGLDEGSAAMFARATGYRPPAALASVVTKYHPGPDAMAAFGSCIHAFLPRAPSIEFGAVIPKGNHLTINIAGKTVDVALMQTFLHQPAVRDVLISFDQAGKHNPADLRFYKGRFPYSLARNYYGDRFVMVGDAAGMVRAFKGKGVTSAVATGIRAARTILQVGVTRSAFDTHYRQANQDIIRDLPYGRAMRLIAIWLARYGLLDYVVRAARHDPSLRLAFYNAVSGHALYRDVLAASLGFKPLLGVLRHGFAPALFQHKTSREHV